MTTAQERSGKFQAFDLVFGDGYHEAVRGVGMRIENGMPIYARVSRRALQLYREHGVLARLNGLIANATLEWGGNWYPDDVGTWLRRRLQVSNPSSGPSVAFDATACA